VINRVYSLAAPDTLAAAYLWGERHPREILFMRTEIISGVNLSQIAAGFLHFAVLLAVQRGLDRLAKKLHVDHLSLVNDRETLHVH
jgi:hypothetical protein